MDLIFGIFPVMFFVVFALFVLAFASVLIRTGKQNRADNTSPRVTSEATVVTKRSHVWGDHSHTDYYATFQFPSGDRLEMKIPHNQFGYLVEGDKGRLTFQGTRFVDFERIQHHTL
jgi:hypothetical protein